MIFERAGGTRTLKNHYLFTTTQSLSRLRSRNSLHARAVQCPWIADKGYDLRGLNGQEF